MFFHYDDDDDDDDDSYSPPTPTPIARTSDPHRLEHPVSGYHWLLGLPWFLCDAVNTSDTWRHIDRLATFMSHSLVVSARLHTMQWSLNKHLTWTLAINTSVPRGQHPFSPPAAPRPRDRNGHWSSDLFIAFFVRVWCEKEHSSTVGFRTSCEGFHFIVLVHLVLEYKKMISGKKNPSLCLEIPPGPRILSKQLCFAIIRVVLCPSRKYDFSYFTNAK